MATYPLKNLGFGGDIYQIAGGSKVSFTQTITSGTKLGAITIDGTTTNIYQPYASNWVATNSTSKPIVPIDLNTVSVNDQFFINFNRDVTTHVHGSNVTVSVGLLGLGGASSIYPITVINGHDIVIQIPDITNNIIKVLYLTQPSGDKWTVSAIKTISMS